MRRMEWQQAVCQTAGPDLRPLLLFACAMQMWHVERQHGVVPYIGVRNKAPGKTVMFTLARSTRSRQACLEP